MFLIDVTGFYVMYVVNFFINLYFEVRGDSLLTGMKYFNFFTLISRQIEALCATASPEHNLIIESTNYSMLSRFLTFFLHMAQYNVNTIDS